MCIVCATNTLIFLFSSSSLNPLNVSNSFQHRKTVQLLGSGLKMPLNYDFRSVIDAFLFLDLLRSFKVWWCLQVLRSTEAVGEHPDPSALPPQRLGGTGPTGCPVQLRGAHPGHGDPVHRLHGRSSLHHQRRKQDLPPHYCHLPQI